MQCELRVTLPCVTPVVGCEINPTVFLSRTGSSETPECSYKFDWISKEPTPMAPLHTFYSHFSWYREQNQSEKFTCCVHHSEIAAFQCMCCVTLKIPLNESYHCSMKCFFDTWENHRARHHQASLSNTTLNGDGQRSGELRSCGSWPSAGTWSAFRNSSVLDGTSIVVEREGRSWIKVGSSKTYVPSMDDVGYILRLESVATDCTKGNPLAPPNIIVTESAITAPDPHPRRMIQIAPSVGSRNFNLESGSSVTGTFSVLSYNVLSDLYAYEDVYSYCPSWALTWEYRQRNLLREIIRYEADILCLQEVQSDHLENFFEPELVKRGYSVMYKRKTIPLYANNRYTIDGCATFFRRDRFKEIRRYELEYSKIAFSTVNALQLHGETKGHIHLSKDNVALVLILELMENGTVSDAFHSRICVANTHIHANSKHTDVKLWQVATLISGLEKLSILDIPVIICGDLNSLPGSAPHSLLVMGRVGSNHEEMAFDPIGILRQTKLKHSLHLVSVYSSLLLTSSGGTDLEKQWRTIDSQHNEPLFTNFTGKFSGTIDYIFYTGNNLRVESLLELLDLESAKKYTALPSPEWSSDHIALMAEFRLKPLFRWKEVPQLPVSLW